MGYIEKFVLNLMFLVSTVIISVIPSKGLCDDIKGQFSIQWIGHLVID
ncbi:hypothetical protein CPS_1762 [Colwellia psychrerythraea 34H]|uniref:Uncharacterized protein n=1 Tax=Colwellia psychrerythraea (strain 34H / ATCC BAA-681) TaxID=167879 RepID=Q484M2_COLP3|nr:hypothetical protein CPS_1762 [Colwellia psychrerythraea 34H]